MTKKEWLDRCEMVYYLGFVEHLPLSFIGADAFFRYMGGQQEYFDRAVEDTKRRTDKTLANDRDGYHSLEALAILTKDCQKCATDKEAWHLRGCTFGCKVK